MNTVLSLLHSARRHTAMALVMAACLLAACNQPVTYHHYEPLPQDGWTRGDSLAFSVDTIVQPGIYEATVCVRTDASYPYNNLALRTHICILPQDSAVMHTSRLNITDTDGRQTGSGITLHTYEQSLGHLSLSPGQRLRVHIAHFMRRECMPGITDVGFKLSRITN